MKLKNELFMKEMIENPDTRSMSSKSFGIEKNSFDIIEDEIGKHTYNKEFEWEIVRRVIHATADFDFAGKQKLLFNHDASYYLVFRQLKIKVI